MFGRRGRPTEMVDDVYKGGEGFDRIVGADKRKKNAHLLSSNITR